MDHSNASPFFRSLQLLFYFLLAGQLLFGGIIWWLLLQGSRGEGNFFTSYSFLAGIILGWMIISAFILYRKRLARSGQLKTLPQKLGHYRVSSIFRWAMLELGNLAVICIAYLEGNSSTMYLFLIGMAIFLLTYPSGETFQKEYNEELHHH